MAASTLSIAVVLLSSLSTAPDAHRLVCEAAAIASNDVVLVVELPSLAEARELRRGTRDIRPLVSSEASVKLEGNQPRFPFKRNSPRPGFRTWRNLKLSFRLKCEHDLLLPGESGQLGGCIQWGRFGQATQFVGIGIIPTQ